MSWFYCADCGSIHTEEELHYEKVENRHWWLDDCPVETWVEVSCPDCGSWDLNECSECECCGEPFRPEDLVDGWCKECLRKEGYDENGSSESGT